MQFAPCASLRWVADLGPGSIELEARLVSASLLLLVVWTFAVPIFEAPDESHHWMNARYIQTAAAAPLQQMVAEGSQAPLYYILLAPLAVKTDFPQSVREVDARGGIESMCPPRFYQNSLQDFARFRPIRLRGW